MQISFKQQAGDPTLGIAFFWKLAIETRAPLFLRDHFIPELCFDYLFARRGHLKKVDPTSGKKHKLPQQILKSLHTHTQTLIHAAPLILYGARLSLKFAELFWEPNLPPNTFLEQTWVDARTHDLNSFAEQVTDYIRTHQTNKMPYPLLKQGLKESNWLTHFSPRHKRRLYTATYGLSRQALQSIQNLHAFLEQTCEFTSASPRGLLHINPAMFYDQPHLTYTFRKMLGLAPSEYFETHSILQDNLISASHNENGRH